MYFLVSQLEFKAFQESSLRFPLVKARQIAAPSQTNKTYNILPFGILQLNAVTQSANPIIFFPRAWTNSSTQWALS